MKNSISIQISIVLLMLFSTTNQKLKSENREMKGKKIHPWSQLTTYQSFNDIPYPYPVKKIKLDDEIELAYVDEGKGEHTIIFIHGLGSYLPAWKKNIEGLKQKYRCIAIDLPGYGKSSKLPHSGEMTFYAETISNFLAAMNINKAIIAGHSMGGQIALTMALKYPDQVEKLILAAPAGFESFTKGQKQWFRNVMTLDGVMKTTVDDIQNNLYYNFYKMPEDASFMITDRIAMRGADDFKSYAYAVVQSVNGMVDQPIISYLDKVQHPVLIMFGENDNLIPNRFLNPGFTKDVADAGHKLLPNSKLVMIPKTGHFLQFESYETFNFEVDRFLSEKH